MATSEASHVVAPSHFPFLDVCDAPQPTPGQGGYSWIFLDIPNPLSPGTGTFTFPGPYSLIGSYLINPSHLKV